MKRLPIWFAMAFLLLGACVAPGPAPALVSPLATVGASVSASPLATAQAEAMPKPAVVVTPSAPDKATITGVLMLDPKAPKPQAGVVLALAEILPNAAGTPSMAGYDRVNAPKTQTDSTGRFVFADVKPQYYALILDRFTSAYMLNRPEDGRDMLFHPEAGQVLDVGTLTYATMPGDKDAP